MSANPRTFEYILAGVDNLVGRGHFHNGAGFRPTQGDALSAYHEYLHNDGLTPAEKLKGFFEIPTGVGKTAVFLAILDEAHRVARANNDKLRAMIVVPTLAIMTQMKEGEQPGEKGEVEEWAPDFMDKVGFYGGDYREFGEELTIITYDSWTTLMEAGEIDSSNVDILVSDEAHRGTSERRIANIFNAFANGTLQVAFTATASFDEDKSVEQSHGRKIFGRGVADSVRLDELAAYIQVQLYMIRLQPPKLTDEFEEVRETEAERLGKKQDAWMRQMVEVMRNGRDLHTNDLLTDNKSGFYVRGTEMADRMARLANADPILQERARVQGKLGVMVSIHSKMHPDEQKARMRAFKRGDYLAAASDTQLKEGFNDKTLKNVFDYPRGSLVDKAQIIGRAARKWFNEAKQRFEGATIIDTIVYEGSDDPEQDERNKNHAIRYAIMAWSVLEGTAVFAPEFEDDRPGHGGGGGGGISPVYGLDVTSYIELEDLQAIYAYQQKLIEGDTIPFSEEMKNFLQAQKVRTSVGGKRLIEIYPELEDGLNETTIINIVKFAVKTVPISTWEKIITAYKSLPDDVKIPFTSEMKKELQAEIKRTGLGGTNFLRKFPHFEEITDKTQIDRMGGDKHEIKTVSQKLWDGLIIAYKSAPNTKFTELTDDMRSALQAEKDRTNISVPDFLARNPLIKEKISESMINSWLTNKKVKRIQASHYNDVLNAYKKLPEDKVVLIDKDMINVLTGHMDRTDVGGNQLDTMFPELKEMGITGNMIKLWKSGRIEKVSFNKWEKVIKIYEAIPGHDKVPYKDEMRSLLKAEIERTGYGYSKFFNEFPNLLEQIDKQTLTNWVHSKNIKMVSERLWNSVISAFQSLPDAEMKRPMRKYSAPSP